MSKRITRRAIEFVACIALICANAGVSPAQDENAAKRDLASADDFRVRVEAALILGKSKAGDARSALEKALSDPHPAVRTAGAAALRTQGDVAAIPALERHFETEGSGAVKSQLRASIDSLRGGGGGGGGGGSGGNTNAAGAKYVVQLGAMKNLTSVRGDQLSQVMRTAARARAASIPGAVLNEGGQLPAGHMPVVVLDGSLLRMSQQAQANGRVGFSAQVEFALRKVPEHTLKASLTGAATSIGTATSLTNASRVSALQDQAVEGAVESAMKNADMGLSAAVAK
jgi:HEAT repeats